MKEKLYLFFLLLFVLPSIYGQSLSPSVIALAGGYEKTPSGMSVSWTLGEPITDPLRSGKVLLTQGFQQPDLKVSTGFEDPTFEYELATFPNPTSNELIMQTNFQQPIHFRMVDIGGKLIREGQWSVKNVEETSSLSQGVYAIYFMVDGKVVKSELISKQ